MFGIKPIEDVYNYSLPEYLKLHGLDNINVKDYLEKVGTISSKDFVPNELDGFILKLIYN